MSADLVERVLDLVRKLRSRGLPVTSAHLAAASSNMGTSLAALWLDRVQ